MSSPRGAPPPQLNAFVLCDMAFQQAVTNKWCIIGTFGVIWAREFPVTHAPLSLFIGLSDFTGDAFVQVNLRDPMSEPVRSVRAHVPKIPLSMAEFAFTFPPVEFKAPGIYTLELLVRGELLTVRSFRVEKAQPPAFPPGFMPPGPPNEAQGGPPAV
jgi:hypothetical protein